MKHLSLLLIVLTVNIINSQNYEHIKKLDTIYIPFREGKYEIKFDYPVEKDGFKNRSYLFNYKKKDEHGFDFEIDKNKTLENKTINKCFLKKNKEKIIEIDSLRKFDYQDIQCELFNRLKIFYIIDFSEKKEKKIKLFRVIFMRHCFVIE
jgi:hypothetical protein